MAILRRALLIGGGVAAASAVGGVVFAHTTFARGWTMGMLANFGPKGRVFTTGEGYLLLGSGGSKQWRFSASKSFVQAFEREEEARRVRGDRRLRSSMVALRYYEMQKNLNPAAGDGDVFVEEILFTEPGATPAAVALPNRSGGRSDSFRVGRIVNLTARGTAFTTWELEMQEGNGGDKFHQMSILDASIYEAALAFLKAGRMVSIDYIRSNVYNPLARETSYEVVSIAAAGS